MRPVAHRCTLMAAMKAEQLSKSYTTATTCKHNSAQIPCISDFHSVVKSAKVPVEMLSCAILPIRPSYRQLESRWANAVQETSQMSRIDLVDYTTYVLFGIFECPSKLSNQSKIWRLTFPIVLIALLVGTTVGVVWHQHATLSPDTCPICHLSHQAIEPAPATARVCTLIPAGSAPEPHHHRSVPSPMGRHVPARAPPA